MHRYLNVRGGFLSVEVDREGPWPRMVLRHHAPDGRIEFEDVLTIVDGQVRSAEHP
jgi:hypothetical protein